MVYNLTITTVNQSQESGEGFHEIHEVKFLSSVHHAVETVRTIIILNKIYSPTIPLLEVEVKTTNKEVYKMLLTSDLDIRFGVEVYYLLTIN